MFGYLPAVSPKTERREPDRSNVGRTAVVSSPGSILEVIRCVLELARVMSVIQPVRCT